MSLRGSADTIKPGDPANGAARLFCAIVRPEPLKRGSGWDSYWDSGWDSDWGWWGQNGF